MDRALELVDRSLPLSERVQRAGLLYWRGAIEGQSGGLLDGVATLHQAAALSEDPSLTLKILRDGCAMADQAGAPDEALSFAERAADASCVGEIDPVHQGLADREGGRPIRRLCARQGAGSRAR